MAIKTTAELIGEIDAAISEALKAQQMGMVVAPAPVFLDSRTGKVLGTPAPATPVGCSRGSWGYR